MAKPTIVTRAGKGSALTWTEGDTNLTNLRDATVTIKADTGGTDVVSDLNGTVTLVAGTNITITGDNTAKTVTINSTASGGASALDDLTDVTITGTPTTGQVLKYSSASSAWVNGSGGIDGLYADTNPSLGGNLTVMGYSIVSASNGDINITPNGTGRVVLGATTLSNYKETIYAGGSQASSYTPNYSNGPVQTVTLTGNVTFGAPTNMVAGSSLTLILTQDATGSRLGSWNASYKFLGGTPVLSTAANSIDVVTVFYDGTNYISGLSTESSTVSINQLQLTGQGELRLADSDSSNYVGFKSPATVSANKVWTLPSADGTNGQVLTTNGSGTLSWATPTETYTGTVTSVSGTGTVNGLSLSGSVTTSGSLTLGGTLDLSSPPAIGGTSPSTGAFTNLTVTGTVNAGGSNGTNGQVLQSTGTGVQWATASSGGTSFAVVGGTITYQEFTGLTSNLTDATLPHTWTEKYDPNGLVTVSADTITINVAGTYFIEYTNNFNGYWYSSSASATNNTIPEATFTLYDASSSTALALTRLGNSKEITSAGVVFEKKESPIFLSGYITVTSTKNITVRRAFTTAGSWGGGLKFVYTYSPNLPFMKITKIA